MLNKWEIRKMCDREYWVGAIRESNNYGKFEIVEYADSRNVRVRFLKTGYERVVSIRTVKQGDISDPLYRTFKYKDVVFKSNNYGEFKIIDYIKNSKIKVKFLDTGYEMYTNFNSIEEGTVKDRYKPTSFGVGYLGDGEYKASPMGVDTKAYTRWHSILMRCYCDVYHRRFPTYKDCSVVEEWHNFQNFAKWFEDNDIEGYHIDKDIKVEGNRVYGPDTCTFVTPQKNKEFSSSKHYKMLDPEGNLVEFFNMSKFCRDNDLSVHNLCNVVAGRRKHHKGYTRYEEENNNDM